MKTYIIIISLMLVFFLIKCGSEPVSQSQKEYNLDEILSDSNWVEVRDTILPYLTKTISKGANIEEITQFLKYNELAIIQNLNDYNQLKKNLDSLDLLKSEIPEIDFNKRTLLGYTLATGKVNSKLKYFFNKITSENLLLIELYPLDNYYWLWTLRSWIIVPKIYNLEKIKVDTIMLSE